MSPLAPTLNTPKGTHEMSEVNALNQEKPDTPDELTLLKQQASFMNIPFSNNIGVEALRKKIAAKMEDEPDTTDDDGVEVSTQTNPLVSPAETPVKPSGLGKPVKVKTLAQHLQDEALKLIRVRITCMDPKKADLEGEIFTVANEYIGTVKKHVPFGEKTDNGYHIPQCILDFLRSRKFLNITTKTGANGQIETKTRWVPEFGIEVLPPLTESELRALAADQRATGRLEGEE